MAIRNSLNGLGSIYGVGQVQTVSTPTRTNAAEEVGAGLGTDEASLSSMGSAMAMSGDGSGVRTNKVANIQAAMASGSYAVTSEEVATKMVDFMLGAGA